MTAPAVTVVVCAAGAGRRAGFEKNKLLVPYQGECALSRLLGKLQMPEIRHIVLAVSAKDEDEIVRLCKPYDNVTVVRGGETRTQSVYNALQAVSTDIVLIHDGARPFVSKDCILGCVDSVKRFGSGICALPCTDTLALADGERICDFPNRAQTYRLQTPQGFYTKEILSAYARAFEKDDASFTDDSSLYAKYVSAPRLCAGDVENVKLTFAKDFLSPMRVGFGVDTHAFGKQQNHIVLGGVKIPSESGLVAHSDGDVLLHAVMDSLLSALGLKDIGHYFPDTDERFENADSALLTEQVVQMVHEQGYAVHNLSVAIQAEKPRLARFIDDMRKRVGKLLHVDENAVGITAGTNEGLGYVGEGKGITVYAYVALKEK